MYIVTRLAMFDTYTEVVAGLKEDWGVDVTVKAIRRYDLCTKTAIRGGDRIAKPLEDLFWDTREKFLVSVEDIPIANRAYRLRKMQELFDRAVEAGETEQARALLEQAAKEVGDVYTNRKLIDVKATNDLAGKSDDEIWAEFSEITTRLAIAAPADDRAGADEPAA